MANFVINSAGDKVIRKTEALNLEITYTPAHSSGDQPVGAYYSLNVYFIQGRSHAYEFEVDATLEGIQSKAATVLAALEAE